MERLYVNRFKVYRSTRWLRTNYLWSKNNPYLDYHRITVQDDSSQPCDVMVVPVGHVPDREMIHQRDDIQWLVTNTSYRGLLDCQDTPIICDSSEDYAHFDPTIRRVLEHPQVRFYLPGVAYRDEKVQQRRGWGSDYHAYVYKNRELYDAGPAVRIERPQLSPQVQAKLLPLNRPTVEPFHDDVYHYIEQRIKPLKDRSIDLSFAGRIRYGARNDLCCPTAMRQQLASIWNLLPAPNKFFLDYDNYEGNLKNNRTIRRLQYPYEYVDHLLESKVVISPWGWSPWCIRDFEALACGCVVIKPECSNLLVYPDIYDPKKQFMVWCDLMYEHLPDQLSYIYQHLDEMQQRVNLGRQCVLDAMYPMAKVYANWTKDIRDILERCLERPSYSTATEIPL